MKISSEMADGGQIKIKIKLKIGHRPQELFAYESFGLWMSNRE